MKLAFSLLLLLSSLAGFSQSIGRDEKASRRQLLQAHQVTISTNASQSPAFQAQNWKAEVSADPQNAEAWLNYYLWTSRDKNLPAPTKERNLAQIASEAEKYAGSSASVYLIRYLQSGKTDSAALYQAFATTTEKSLIYPYLIQHSILRQDRSSLAKHAAAFGKTAPLSPALNEYYFNVLMSADSGAVIYANGVADLASLAIRQQQGVRKDLQLKYYDSATSEGNAFLSLALGTEILRQHTGASYAGLLLQLGSAGSIEQLRQKLEKDFVFDFLDQATVVPTETGLLFKNYLPSFILLYKYLKKKSDPSAVKWQERILKIARWSGSEASVLTLLNN